MDGDRMIDPDLMKYLDNFKKDMTTAFKESENHIRETLKLNIDPIKETTDRHTKDIDDLYNKDRENRDRFGIIEADVKTLKENKNDGKHNKELNMGYIGIIVGIIVATVGWLI